MTYDRHYFTNDVARGESPNAKKRGFFHFWRHLQNRLQRPANTMKHATATPGPRQTKIIRKSGPAARLRALGGWVGGSIGQAEALAGINTQSVAERTALWNKFRHLFGGDSQALVEAMVDHCAAITLRRIKNGELCLLQAHY